MMKKIAFQLIAGTFFFFFVNGVWAHCEIPCGIYDDQARFNSLNEHITTMEKSMKQILSLENQKGENTNQIVRWVMNNETHANSFQKIVSQYFMTQRVKIDTKEYDQKIKLLHHMLVYSMKCKQTTDINNISILRGIVKEFRKLYAH
jgi:nickel superoxide dismutase